MPDKEKSTGILCGLPAFLTQYGANLHYFQAIIPYGVSPKRVPFALCTCCRLDIGKIPESQHIIVRAVQRQNICLSSIGPVLPVFVDAHDVVALKHILQAVAHHGTHHTGAVFEKHIVLTTHLTGTVAAVDHAHIGGLENTGQDRAVFQILS